MVTDISVKENIRLLRKREGLSQKEMAQKIGVSRTSYRKLEKEDTTIINEKIYRIASSFGIPVEAILFGEDFSGSEADAWNEVADLGEQLSTLRKDYEERLEQKDQKIREQAAHIDDLNAIIQSQKNIIAFLEKHSNL